MAIWRQPLASVPFLDVTYRMILYGLRAPFPFVKGLVRHIRPVWLMEELGAPYDLQYLDLETEKTEKAYLEINPFGRVPSLQDGALKLFESGAICTYLADRYEKLIPAVKTHERAIHDQWMYVAVTMIEPHTARLFAADFFYKGEPEEPLFREAAIESLEGSLAVLENHFAKNKHLCGNEFTVSDILMTTSLRIASHTDLLSKYPRIAAYVKLNSERPAFQRAVVQQ